MTVAADLPAGAGQEPDPSPAELHAQRDYRFGLDLTDSGAFARIQGAYLRDAHDRLNDGAPLDAVLCETARGVFAYGYGVGAAITDAGYRPVTPAAAVPLANRIIRALVGGFGKTGA